MNTMSIVGQNERGETKFERPLVVGKRDVLILQFPDDLSHEYLEEVLRNLDDAINGEYEGDQVPIVGMSDSIKIRVLRIDN